ncbi:AAA family ATPase [Ornithinimicrobium faecis]|uniref:AAA family ATPase n=1 Tax=Ornithinimicrobium faecis TaxID=2934158 RepID=A0ABY4YSF0_9MICO|nr:AAA family ATPase [Ornithinimicrobium sp. HY1793]USQ79519.1 AAA family ATPase [Ornithinimicrobium sp. HY1793]
MKLHRLHLRDVKGVVDRSIDFPDTGVVVIEGPNEVGKTTLLEAFDLLLDPRAKATSQSRAVKALKPLGRDVGPRVEAEFSVGRHRLRFAKQWLRGASTELEILSPVREHHSGEEAQHRLDAILAESLDRPLWDALRFTQGGELGQMALTDSAVLTEALDGASGVDLHSADGASLLEQVEREFRRYYTATGRLTGELKDAVAAASTARDEAVHAHRAVTETQELVERHERLRNELTELTDRETSLTTQLATAREHDAEVTELVRAHDESTAALARARQDSVRAGEDLARRERAQQDLTDAQERLRAAAESITEKQEALAALQQDTAPLVEARDTARGVRDQAVEVAGRASADVELVEVTARVATLERTAQRLRQLRAEETDERAVLEDLPDLDADAVRSLEAADRTVVELRSRLEASSARVSVEVLGERRSVVVNGETVDVSGESGADLAVRGGLTLELPGDLRVTVRPEESSAQLATDLATAQGLQSELLEQAGVRDLAAAREVAVNRASVAARIRHVAEQIDDLLGGQRPEHLSSELEQAQSTLAELSGSRPQDYPLPEDVATARAVSRAASAARQEAAAALEQAEVALREHERRCDQVELQVERAVAVQSEVSERLERDRSRLAESQEHSSDDALREAVQVAGSAYARVEAQVGVTRRALEEADVDGVRSRLARIEQTSREHQVALGRVRQQLAQVQGQVELVSGEGRQEVYAVAVDEFLRLKGVLDVVHGKARAARQLHETLGRHRDAAHRAYVRPYRDEIRRLGQAAYGASFDVEVADDLTISSRALEGTSVPFDQLSGGAKEQLGILSRLAVAGLVESGAGVPVIIDDALGYTDPERLQRVSTVFSGPGERTQVVLLTCTPDRYRELVDATTIQLTA